MLTVSRRSDMLTDSRVVYLFVYVRDLGESRAFYESTLGLQVIEEDKDCVKFDGGQVILALNRAADYGIDLPKGQDTSTDIVFLVDDLEAMRTALEQRGVSFLPTSWYQPGGIADFYDPDGHWLTLYEPSKEAMMWPSGDRIRALMSARQQRNATPSASEIQSRSSGASDSTDLRLHGSDIFYLFFFVPDPAEAFTFYHENLGLLDLEGGPCSRATSGDEDGVVKWDAGGLLLTTHHIDGARSVSGVVLASEVEEHTCPPREIDEKRMKGVAPVFYAKDIEHMVQKLSRKYEGFGRGLKWTDIGAVTSFEDPSGHMIFLYEPSAEALQSPSGAKIKEILATPLPDRELQLLREAFPDNRFRDDYSEEGLPAC